IWSRYLQGRYYDGVCYNTAMVASGILGLSNFNRYLFAVEALAGLKTVNITLDKQNRSTTFRLGQSPTYEIDTIPTRQSFVITGTNTAAQLDAMMKSIRSNFTPGAMLCTPRTSVYFKVAASTYLNALTLNEWYPKDYRMDDSSLRAFGDRELLEVMQTLNEKGGHCLTFITPDLIVESNGNLPHNLVSSSKAIQLIVDSEHLSGEFSRLAFFYLPVNHERILDWSKKASYFQPSAPYAKLLSMISKAHDILESVNVAPDRPQKGFGLSNAVKNTPSVQAKMQKLYATEFRPLLQDPHFAKYAWATRQAKQLGIAMISKLSQQPAMPKTAGVIETAPYQNLLKRYFDYYSMVFGPGFSEIEFQAYIGLEQMFSDTVVTGPQTL
ncbi:MAG TPA: hypothetical protein PKC28_15065, partial [Bdellovibrionales bacterium]|nr:hypothetical protein [Bdellovibrionales bacterium]